MLPPGKLTLRLLSRMSVHATWDPGTVGNEGQEEMGYLFYKGQSCVLLGKSTADSGSVWSCNVGLVSLRVC